MVAHYAVAPDGKTMAYHTRERPFRPRKAEPFFAGPQRKQPDAGRHLVRITNTENGKTVHEVFTKEPKDHDGWYASDFQICYSADSRLLAVCSSQALRIIDLQTGDRIADSPIPRGSPTSITFSPSGKSVAVGWENGVVRTWKVTDLIQ